MNLSADAFHGIFIPVITCFKGAAGEEGVDFEAQRRVLAFSLNEMHADGIVACATTGEATALTEEEYEAVAEFCLKETKKIKSNAPVLLGTSSTSPQATFEKNEFAKERGFDGVLLTHPPYIKPDQRGIKSFFETVCARTPELPVIIYNIWYRTGGKGISAETLISLADLPSIKGVKDAGVDIEHTEQVISATKNKDFAYLSGEDAAVFDTLVHGGDGTILASAHVTGKYVQEMRSLILGGKARDALGIYRKIKGITKHLFREPNPCPLKAALNELGLKVGEPRGPALLPVTQETRAIIREELKTIGLL